MKKSSMISFLTTLLLAAATLTHGKEPVKDTAGNSLKTGQQYFIQPVKTESNKGGGLVPAAITVAPFCPLGITQTLLPFQPGLPVSFAFADSAQDSIVQTSTDVTIEFKSEVWPFCNDFSKLWAVSDSSSASKEPSIIIGGKPKSQNSRFKIEKAGGGAGANTYKLTSLTGNVGAIPGVWMMAPQLVLTNDNAKTIFVKFNKVDNAITSSSRVEKSGLRMLPFY